MDISQVPDWMRRTLELTGGDPEAPPPASVKALMDELPSYLEVPVRRSWRHWAALSASTEAVGPLALLEMAYQAAGQGASMTWLIERATQAGSLIAYDDDPRMTRAALRTFYGESVTIDVGPFARAGDDPEVERIMRSPIVTSWPLPLHVARFDPASW